MAPLLSIHSLMVTFPLILGEVKAVDRVDLTIDENEIVGLIGESGCGKSVLGLSILGLLPGQAEVSGTIRYQGEDMFSCSRHKLRYFRGDHIAWIPQNPVTSFNPSIKTGFQVAETIYENEGITWDESWNKTYALFREMDIIPEKEQAKRYPWQYSGGMLQRALIAMGICCEPDFIIADEPTKGLDTIRRRQVLDLFRAIKQPGKTMLLITHDLMFARAIADRIAIMYCGQILEIANINSFETGFFHPYSQALLQSLPSQGLMPIPGDPPSMVTPPSGCRFRPRCKFVMDICEKEPEFVQKAGSYVKCWRCH